MSVWGRRALIGAVAALAVCRGAAPALRRRKKPFRVVTTFTVIQDIAQNVAGSAAVVEVDHQAGRGDPRLSADAARHREGAGGRPRAVERLQPRALVREVLRERQGSAERRRDRGHRADGDRGRPLHRQAQPACLDVAEQRADLCREHPQGAGEARSRQRRRLQQERRRLCGADQGARRAAAQAARRDPREPALAGVERGRVQLPHARLQDAGSLSLADQRRRAGHAASRCAR